MKNTFFASLLAVVLDETGSVTIWDRPAAKAEVERPEQPLTPVQLEARPTIAQQIHKVLVDAIAEDNKVGAFITPSENGRTALLALSLPMDALTFQTEDGDTISTNKWVLNLNVAIPGEKKAKDNGRTVVETKAMTFAELRKATQAARSAAKDTKK
jgi:hypothetical protein